MKTEFTQSQIDDFKAYELVRQSGEYNMLDQAAVLLSGLSAKAYSFVQRNYADLKIVSDRLDLTPDYSTVSDELIARIVARDPENEAAFHEYWTRLTPRQQALLKHKLICIGSAPGFVWPTPLSTGNSHGLA